MKKQKEEQAVKILDVFHTSFNSIISIIDCNIEPKTGYFLTDNNDNALWKITGVVLTMSHSENNKPVKYLENKNYLRSVSLKAVKENAELKKGDIYYLKEPPLLIK